MAPRGITILDEHIANKIAAGEVIERPASVVKELVENALDAGAKRVEIDIRQGGKEHIRVTDDGVGMAPDQVPLAFARHATSKIHSADDLFNVNTLGFRGEALPSIAAVAEVELRTRPADATGGVRFTVEAGRTGALEPVGSPVGTTIVVRRLFFNTPARYKFLRSDAAERRRVSDAAARIALAWPGVAFRLVVDGRQVFSTPGDGDLAGAIRAIYGTAAGAAIVRVDGELDGIRVHGYVGKPDIVHGNRDRMSVFLNGRWIQSAAIVRAIEQGYETLLPPRRYPLAVIHLTVDPASVDVNVHPAKAEVRFKDDRAVFRAVLRAVRAGLLDANLVGTLGTARPVGVGSGEDMPAARPGTGELGRGTRPPWTYGTYGSGLAFGEAAAAEAATEWPVRTGSSDNDRSAQPLSSLPAQQSAGPTAEPSAQPSSGRSAPLWEHPPARPLHPPPSPPWESTSARSFEQPPVQSSSRSAARISCAHRYSMDAAASSTGQSTGLPGLPGASTNSPDGDARRMLRDMTVIGQLHRTFIIGETGHGLWIIDQHVAHERILYERFLERGASGSGAVQQMLIPVTVTLSPDRVGMVEQFQAELERLGFVLEPFGGSSYIVRGIPVELTNATDAGRLTGLLEELLDACERDGAWSPHVTAAALACRAAIKAGQPLDTIRMKKLVQELAAADNPFACPHGRPIVIELGRLDLERRFGRR